MVALRAKGDSPNLEPMKTFFEGAFPDAVLKVRNSLSFQFFFTHTSSPFTIFNFLFPLVIYEILSIM